MLIYNNNETRLAFSRWLCYLHKENPEQEQALLNIISTYGSPHTDLTLVLHASRWNEMGHLIYEFTEFGNMPPKTCWKCKGSGWQKNSIWIPCSVCNGTKKVPGDSYCKHKPVEVKLPTEFDLAYYAVYDEHGDLMDKDKWQYHYNGGLISFCRGNKKKTKWSMNH